jgi:hypothetical protein
MNNTKILLLVLFGLIAIAVIGTIYFFNIIS